MSDDKPFFISPNTGFGAAVDADELLHPLNSQRGKVDSLTETQYFGFCIPEQRIHGYGYLWHHPSLKVVSGGLLVWQGHKRLMNLGELCDYRDFMSDTVLDDDLHEYRFDNGYGVRVVEPLKRHHVTYSDPQRGNSVDLHYEAVAPPVMFGSGTHFEQAMKVVGTLTLRGRAHPVDCHTLRDRSWGKPRPEETMSLPPVSWMQGVFSDDFAFSCNVMDQAVNQPELRGTPCEVPAGETLMGGWLHRDGTVGRLVTADKHVVRLPQSRLPHAVELKLIDEFDRSIHVRGNAIASSLWQPWTNMYMPIVLMRWECEGHIAHGDCQEAIWTDYLNLGN